MTGRLRPILAACIGLFLAPARASAQIFVSTGAASGLRMYVPNENDWWLDPSLGRLDVRVNGGASPLMSVLSGGSVGVGTASPDALLETLNGHVHLKRNDGSDQLLYLDNLASQVSRIRFLNAGTNVGDIRVNTSSNTIGFGAVGGSDGFRYGFADGYVGIGTTSPASPLSVSNATYPQLLLNSPNSNGAIVQFSENGTNSGAVGNITLLNALQFSTGSAVVGNITPPMMTLNNTGLGIMSTSPVAPLSVNGTIFTNAALAAGNNSLALNSAGSNSGQIFNSGTGSWSLGYGTSLINQGTPVLSWNAGGNVGIGTTNPGYVLVSSSAVSGDRVRIYNSNAIGTATLELQNDSRSASRAWALSAGYDADGGLSILQGATQTGSAYGGSATSRMVFDPSGNVGIGTANPANYKLVIGGTGAGSGFSAGVSLNGGESTGDYDGIGYNFRNTGTSGAYNYNVADTSSRLEFWNGGFRFKTAPSGTAGNAITYADVMTILQGGAVGIGTTSPNATLSVAGSVAVGSVSNTNAGAWPLTVHLGTNQNIDFRGESGNSAIQAINDAGSASNNLVLDAINVLTAGNVGIGVTSPAAPLEIGGTAAGGVLKLDGGDGVSGASHVTQIAFGYGGGPSYPSFIATRHNAGSSAGNSMLFYTGDGTAAGVFPTNAVLGLTITAGNVAVAGSLSKGSGSFLIDDPLDPRNKTLQHSFVESPEMMNVYKGNGRTSRGRRQISMPDWFVALNGKNKADYSFAITPLNGSCGDYHVENAGIVKGAFNVVTAKDCEFSWVVYAVRHDAYANAHRIPVVQEKGVDNQYPKGQCLHEEACRSTPGPAK